MMKITLKKLNENESIFVFQKKPYIQLNDLKILKYDKEHRRILFESNKFIKMLYNTMKLLEKNNVSAIFDDSTQIFNQNEESLSDLPKNLRYADVIVSVKKRFFHNLIDNETNYDLIFKILQIRVFEEMPADMINSKSLFTEKKIKNPVEEKSESGLPEKYEKMLKMGIPLAAVKQKMDIDKMRRPLLLNKVVLKKVEIPPSKKNNKETKSGFGMDLATLQETLKKLKKTKKCA